MAVFDDSGITGSDLAAFGGDLMITDRCVTVDGYTMVWGASGVRWMPDSQAIHFNDPIAGVVVELKAGDQVRLGGGETSAELPWVAEPDASCPERRFAVGNIGSVNGIEP
ncbi:MAG: hypothetical protein ACRDE6_06830 [Candidatus Limnocylindria bacterium]